MKDDILVIFPSNSGDVILTFPALDMLHEAYPYCRITALVSPQTEQLLRRHSFIAESIVYDKHWGMREKACLCSSLRGRYRMVVDFKHTLFPLLLKASLRTPLIRSFREQAHSKDRYVNLLRRLVSGGGAVRGELLLWEEERARWDALDLSGSVFVAAASKSLLKQYPHKNLVATIEELSHKYRVVLVGSKEDVPYYRGLASPERVIDLSGQTSLWDVYYLLKRYAALLVCVDSSILHLASYLDKPIVALFGPTDARFYGPWSKKHLVLTSSQVACRPCHKAACTYALECMKQIAPLEVLGAVSTLLAGEAET